MAKRQVKPGIFQGSVGSEKDVMLGIKTSAGQSSGFLEQAAKVSPRKAAAVARSRLEEVDQEMDEGLQELELDIKSEDQATGRKEAGKAVLPEGERAVSPVYSDPLSPHPSETSPVESPLSTATSLSPAQKQARNPQAVHSASETSTKHGHPASETSTKRPLPESKEAHNPSKLMRLSNGEKSVVTLVSDVPEIPSVRPKRGPFHRGFQKARSAEVGHPPPPHPPPPSLQLPPPPVAKTATSPVSAGASPLDVRSSPLTRSSSAALKSVELYRSPDASDVVGARKGLGTRWDPPPWTPCLLSWTIGRMSTPSPQTILAFEESPLPPAGSVKPSVEQSAVPRASAAALGGLEQSPVPFGKTTEPAAKATTPFLPSPPCPQRSTYPCGSHSVQSQGPWSRSLCPDATAKTSSHGHLAPPPVQMSLKPKSRDRVGCVTSIPTIPSLLPQTASKTTPNHMPLHYSAADAMSTTVTPTTVTLRRLLFPRQHTCLLHLTPAPAASCNIITAATTTEDKGESRNGVKSLPARQGGMESQSESKEQRIADAHDSATIASVPDGESPAKPEGEKAEAMGAEQVYLTKPMPSPPNVGYKPRDAGNSHLRSGERKEELPSDEKVAPNPNPNPAVQDPDSKSRSKIQEPDTITSSSMCYTLANPTAHYPPPTAYPPSSYPHYPYPLVYQPGSSTPMYQPFFPPQQMPSAYLPGLHLPMSSEQTSGGFYATPLSQVTTRPPRAGPCGHHGERGAGRHFGQAPSPVACATGLVAPPGWDLGKFPPLAWGAYVCGQIALHSWGESAASMLIASKSSTYVIILLQPFGMGLSSLEGGAKATTESKAKRAPQASRTMGRPHAPPKVFTFSNTDGVKVKREASESASRHHRLQDSAEHRNPTLDDLCRAVEELERKGRKATSDVHRHRPSNITIPSLGERCLHRTGASQAERQSSVHPPAHPQSRTRVHEPPGLPTGPATHAQQDLVSLEREEK
eukprot:Em0215g1a